MSFHGKGQRDTEKIMDWLWKAQGWLEQLKGVWGEGMSGQWWGGKQMSDHEGSDLLLISKSVGNHGIIFHDRKGQGIDGL